MRHVTTTIACAAALGVVASLLPAAASAAPSDPQPRPGRSSGQPVTAGANDGSDGSDGRGAGPTFGGLERGLSQRLDRARRGQKVRLVVKADSRAALPSARRSVDRVGAPQGLGLAKLGYTTVEVDAEDAAATAQELASSPGVESVTVARSRSLHLFVPDDTKYAAQQHTMFAAMQAQTAWDTAQGAGVTIAVLDGGFDVNHPDIDGKILDTYDAANGDAGVEDTPGGSGVGHGTATSSTAAAETNNAQGIAGSAPLANLLLVKVADDQDILDSAYSAAGIRWAADNGADVINMSYGGHDADTVEGDAVAYARSKGVVVVASAGNNYLNTVNYPAAWPGVISVGATNLSGTTQTDWATDGSWVDVAAPGETVAVAVPTYADDDGVVDGYTRWDGTSFSGPLVAGLAAVLRSHRPGAPATTIEKAIITTTKAIAKPTGVSALGHGLVQFQNALAALPADTTITLPVGDSAVSGAVAVSATSGAARVRFAIQGTPVAVTVPVSAGQAVATLPTFGLDEGAATITAVSCDASSCAQTGDAVPVQIGANAAPTITAPADGAPIGTTLDATADAGEGAAVKFLVDGTISAGTDTAAPYSIAWDTFALSDGAHTLTAYLCNPLAPSVCETDNPSASVGFTVLRLRPTAKATVSVFSPNADGRRDTATGTYTFDVPSTGSLSVKNAAGATVRGPIALGTKPSGTYAWSWNGKSNAGTVQPDGTYTVVVVTSATKNEQAGVPGIARAAVRLDRTRPALSSLSASPTTFYPVSDGYKDTASIGATTKETTSSVTVTIYNSAGSKIRTITSARTRPAGRVALAWNGRTGGGSLVKAGTFTYRVLVQDVAGNRTLSAKGSVTVNLKKRVKKTASKTIAPELYNYDGYFDPTCSRLYYGIWQNYPYSHGYFSRARYVGDTLVRGGCTDNADDFVVAYYKFTLPTAMQYLSVRVSAYAGSHLRNSNSGFAEGITAWGEGGSDWGLGPTDGIYSSRSLPAADYLRNGRTIHWLAGTWGGNLYDVRNFTVYWSYYVLQ